MNPFPEALPELAGPVDRFVSVLGVLGTLVVLSVAVERALAWVYEQVWFAAVATKRPALLSGVKGGLALALSLAVCHRYRFDIFQALFDQSRPSQFGMNLTALVVAGGSAGAIAVFQAYLNMSKAVRDSVIAAHKAEADARRIRAEASQAQAALPTAQARADAAALQVVEKEHLLRATTLEVERQAQQRQLEAQQKKEPEGKK